MHVICDIGISANEFILIKLHLARSLTARFLSRWDMLKRVPFSNFPSNTRQQEAQRSRYRVKRNKSSVNARMITILFLLISIFVEYLNSCGVSTHISIAEEALQSFTDNDSYNVSYRNIILGNPDAFFAGSNYPDAFYSTLCFDGSYHQVSEDTHWAPFLNATVNYIRKTYPKPWDQATRKLIAFTFGFVSHQVADVTWHSLGIDQGFLRTMGNVNFHGSFDTAHPIGDVGGDMVSMFEGDLQNVFSSDTWYIPTNDLVNIYKELYGEVKITEDIIAPCSFLLYAEWIGELLGGADLFPYFASKSPFLVEELHSYYLGGKSDMAAWTSMIWHETTRMIENGPKTCDIPKSTLHLKCNHSRTSKLSDRIENNNLHSRPKIQFFHFKKVNQRDITAKPTLRGVDFAITGETVKKVQQARKRLLSIKKRNKLEREEKSSGLYTFSTKNKYARLGWSLISDQLTGFDQTLIAGSPWYGIPGNSQHGRVYMLSASREYSSATYIDESADQILQGEVENSRFGFAIAVLDFNADGLNDLAVSAPSEGSNDLNYTGKVYVYYGNGTGVSSNPGAVITGDQHYFNLGTSLISGDVNMDGLKDLIIGSKFSPMGGEQRGSVAVFFSGKKNYNKRAIKYNASQADWLLKGKQNYGWFGHEVAFHNKTSLGPILIVSAPTYRVCVFKNCSYSPHDIQSVGKLYAYRWLKNGSSKLLFEITGKTSLGKLGTSLAIGDPFSSGENDILAVSSPSAAVEGFLPLKDPATFNQAGRVVLFSLKILALEQVVSLPETEHVALFEGDREYGRFGWHVSWQDVNQDGASDLVIGSPYRTNDVSEVGGGEEGAVYVFFGGSSFPQGNATRNCKFTDVEPCPNQKASLYFQSNQKFSQFGRNVIAMKEFSHTPSIVIAAPRQTDTSLHNGIITVFRSTNNDSLGWTNLVR